MCTCRQRLVACAYVALKSSVLLASHCHWDLTYTTGGASVKGEEGLAA